MAHDSGWILDVSIDRNHAIIWIKTIDGQILKLSDIYQPTFYALPKNDDAGAEIFQILSQESIVKKVEWQHKFTDLFDPQGRGIKRLICVQSESTLSYSTLLKRLEGDERVAQLYNVELSHVQQYLFTTLKIEPTRNVEIEYEEGTSRLIRITTINEPEVAPPPFTILYFDNPDSDGSQIKQIGARYQEDPDVSFEGEEEG